MKCGTFRKGCEMRNNQKSKSSAGTLRQQAEQRLATLPMGEPPLRPDDYERVFYELRVHKIELEIQNEELRRTQTELEVRRALYFDLYDLAPVSYCTLSAQGLILEANLTVATLLGLPRGELVGRILSKFMFEPDVEIYYRHHRQLLATREPQDYELRMRHAQGSLVWVRVGATVAEDAQGRTVSRIVLSDISGRKVEEEALRVSEERFRGLFEHMAEGLAICRMLFEDGEPRDFVYLSVNHAFETLTGLRHVVGRKFSEVLPGALESDPQIITTYGRVVQTGRPQKFEVFVNALNMWLSISAYSPEPGCFVAVFDVITERKQAEDDARHSLERLALAQRSSGSGVWDWDMTSGELSWTPEMFHLFGLDPENSQATFETWRSAVHPDDLEVAEERIGTAVRDHLRLENNYRIVLGSGEVHWVHALGDTTYDSAGQPLRMTGICIDISERKRVEEVLSFLAKTSSGVTSEEPFFRSLARYLSEALQMDFVCIDRLEGSGLNARTEAVWCDGHFEDNITYALKDTPCGDVVGKEICFFPSDVCQLFPRDQVLVELRAESYAGVTLWSHTGQPIGLIAVIGRRPMGDRALVDSTLRLVAQRAAGEIERMQAEEALRKNEQRFRSYFDMPLIGVCITSPTTGWLEVNDQLCAMLGYERTELLSTLWPQLTHPDDLAADLDHYNRVLQGEIDQYRLEKRFLHKNGEVIDVDLSVGCVRNSDRTVNFFVALLLDITERKRAETALQLALGQRTSLVKEIHHRVKNNLAIMVSLINMQVRRIKHPDALTALADTKSRLYSMSSLHEMLYRTGRMDRVEAKGYLELLCAHLSQTCGMSAQGIDIKNRSSAALTLEIDQAVPCGLIINELVSNALKHAFPNARQGRLKVELLATADCVILRVDDNGIGLPDSLKMERVAGVGLTLVNTLTRQLGGTLQIRSKNGTRFEIRFPLRPTTPS